MSIALHVLALWQLPGIKMEKEPLEPILIVEIAPPKKVEPPPVEAPEPPPVKQPAAKPTPPKPVVKPEPVVKAKPLPSPITEPLPINKPDIVAPTPPPAVIAAAPKLDSQPAFVAPSPEPAKPATSQPDITTDTRAYGVLLGNAIAKQKQYPKIAQMRGWQGEVTLELKLDGNGNLLSSKVHTSSDFDALDKQALEMVKKALPFPPIPEGLHGRSFTILVPVSFRLE